MPSVPPIVEVSHDGQVLLQLGACVGAQRRGDEALQIYKAVMEAAPTVAAPQGPTGSMGCPETSCPYSLQSSGDIVPLPCGRLRRRNMALTTQWWPSVPFT